MIAKALLGSSPFLAGQPGRPLPFPASSTECIFMGHAVEDLAKAKYGPVWTGREPHTQLPELLPEALHPMFYNALSNPEASNNSNEPVQWFDPPPRAVLERADDLLVQHRPDLERPSRFEWMFGGLSPRPLRFTIREWKIAQGLAKKERDECFDALSRWFDLQDDIVSLCESGVLETVLRPVEGGEFSAVLPKAHWRTERCAMRFVTFMMHPTSPFKISSPNEMQWIFFTRASLRIAKAKLTAPNSTGSEEGGYRSEYLAFMIEQSQKLGIVPDDPRKKSDIKYELSRAWQGREPLSERHLEAMATFLRSPESKLGLRRPRSKPKIKGATAA